MNPHTIAYQEMMKSWKESEPCKEINSLSTLSMVHGGGEYRGQTVSDFLTYWYLHQLEEEVKRLGEKKVQKSKGDEILDLAKIESVSSGTKSGWNSALDQEIALCESAIKEIKAL